MKSIAVLCLLALMASLCLLMMGLTGLLDSGIWNLKGLSMGQAYMLFLKSIAMVACSLVSLAIVARVSFDVWINRADYAEEVEAKR